MAKTTKKTTRKVEILGRYRNLGLAKSAAENSERFVSPLPVMGDDGFFWIVTVADAQRLKKAGYEVAK